MVDEPQRPAGKRGPKTDMENHAKVAGIVSPYGENWATEDNIFAICEQLDRDKVPIPKTWATLREHPARSWPRALAHHRDLVKKAIRYHCEVAASAASQLPLTFADS
jgi:hypothetical protein